MKYLAVAFLLIATSFTAVSNEPFEAGVNYTELDNQLSEQHQIVEYFSFYCPHCYNQEPFMADVKTLLPSPDMFSKNHVENMPGRNLEIERLLTKALITAKLLKIDKKIVAAIFDYIHKNRANFTAIKDIKNLFILNGVASNDFDKTFNSFKVKVEETNMQRNTNKLRKHGFGSVQL